MESDKECFLLKIEDSIRHYIKIESQACKNCNWFTKEKGCDNQKMQNSISTDAGYNYYYAEPDFGCKYWEMIYNV